MMALMASGTHLDDAEAQASQMLDVTRHSKALNQSFVKGLAGILRLFRILKGTASANDEFSVFAYRSSFILHQQLPVTS